MPVDQRQDPSLSALPDGATMFKEYEKAVRRILALAASTPSPLPEAPLDL